MTHAQHANRNRNEASTVRAGFMALTDCAPLVIAAAKGFDKEHGFELKLTREASWASVRDKLAHGTFQCAHMLAPMPIASALGLGPGTEPIIAPMALNRGGSVVTVSADLYRDMGIENAEASKVGQGAGSVAPALAIKAVINRRRELGASPLTLGMVFPFSSHNYDLRHWLSAVGIDPDEDVNLIVIPPPLLADALASNRIDGFCAGAPWGQVAVEGSGAHIVATKADIWPTGPEKVLGVRESWAQSQPELLEALIGALVGAGRWLDEPDNFDEAAALLARPEAVGVPAEFIKRALTGRLVMGRGQAPTEGLDFIAFQRGGVGLPRRSHALWLMAQMIRWGHVRQPFDLDAVAARAYRPDLYRAALIRMGETMDEPDTDVSGLGQSCCDGVAALEAIARSGLRSRYVDLTGFAALNRR